MDVSSTFFTVVVYVVLVVVYVVMVVVYVVMVVVLVVVYVVVVVSADEVVGRMLLLWVISGAL